MQLGFPQPGISLPALRDVSANAHHELRLSLLVHPNDAGGGSHPNVVTAFSADTELNAVGSNSSRCKGGQCLLHNGAVLGMDPSHPPLPRLRREPGLITEHSQGDLIKTDKPRGEIPLPESLRSAFHGKVQPLFLFKENLLALLQVSYVCMGPEHHQRLPRFIPGHYPPPVENPDPATALMPHAILTAVARCSSRDAVGQCIPRLLQVAGVNQPCPGFVVVWSEFLKGVTQHRCPLLVEAGVI